MQKTKVLIVDDDVKLSSLVKLLLTQRGFVVREENRSSAALSTARKYLPDVVILDINMPGKNGVQVAHEMRTDQLLKHIPIMFLTCQVSSTDTAPRDGMLFVAKPVDVSALVEALQTLLDEPSFSDAA